MKWPDIYLLCFATGSVWSLATLLLGGMHFGHGHATGGHAHHGIGGGHGHHGIGGGHAHHGIGGGHGHHGAGGGHGHHGSAHQASANEAVSSWIGSMVNPNSVAAFLAWFGGIGYLLTRHTGLLLWVDLAIASGFGLIGAFVLASFLRFLQSREKPLDPADYDMVGVLGRISSPVRPGGVGELIFTRDGARRPMCARSEDGDYIGRDTEVVVTRFEKGIAYVRTWDAMLMQPSGEPAPNPAKEKESVD